jgi:hypothetical protein
MSWDQNLLTQIKQEFDLDSFLKNNDDKRTENQNSNKETHNDDDHDFHESFNSALVEDLDTNEQVNRQFYNKNNFFSLKKLRLKFITLSEN